MNKCESTSKFLAGLGGAVLLYIAVMGGTPALAGQVDIPGLPKTSAFVLWAVVAVGVSVMSQLRCRVFARKSSKE